MGKRGFTIKRGAKRQQSDSHIGLTEAFAPVGENGNDVIDADGQAIGLTQAFEPVSGGAHAAHATNPNNVGDTAKHGEGTPYDSESVEVNELAEEGAVVPASDGGSKHGSSKNKNKKKKEKPIRSRRSRRARRILIVVIILLILLIAGLAYFGYQLYSESQRAMVQQTQTQQQSTDTGSLSQSASGKDASSATTTKKTEVPNIVSVLGKTQEESVTTLAHGATVTSSKDVNEEGNSVKKNVTVALTAEPADSRSGTPTVYLGLNEEGKVIQVGYSAATASLGYGSLSFVDAVKNEHVVEKTFQTAGVPLSEGAVELPSDKAKYSQYASDGTTLTKETCSFSGSVDVGGTSRNWSSVLTYDYSTANTSGNLADTIRLIYIYINS